MCCERDQRLDKSTSDIQLRHSKTLQSKEKLTMKQMVKKGLIHLVSNNRNHENTSRHIPSSDAVTVPMLAYTDQLTSL